MTHRQTDDEATIYCIINNALTFFEDAEMLCQLVNDRCLNPQVNELAQTLCNLFETYKDEIITISHKETERPNKRRHDADSKTFKIVMNATGTTPHENNDKTALICVDGNSVQTQKNESAFAWIEPNGKIDAISIPHKRSVKDEKDVLNWLIGHTHERGVLIVCSGGGLGGFPDVIAGIMKNFFHFPLFCDAVGNEAYIGVSVCKSLNEVHGNEKIINDAILKHDLSICL